MDAPPKAHDAVFDQIMEMVGDDGVFQKRFNYLFNIGVVFCAALLYNNMLFALNTPDHWCHVPGREQTNYTLEQWKNLTLPRYSAQIRETFTKDYYEIPQFFFMCLFTLNFRF